MSRVSRQSFWLSVTIHVAVILSLFIIPLIMNWRMRKKEKHEIITYVDLQTVTLPAPPAVLPEPPKDIPEPIPKKKRRKIETSKKRIKKDPETKPDPKPQLTPEEIKKLLDSGAKLAKGPQPKQDLPAWYFALVRQTMYDKWKQPSELAGNAGLMTRVSFRISRNGRISKAKLIKPSGSSVMDGSVMEAVRAVRQLKALPSTYPKPYKDVTVDFELTSGSF